MTRPHAGFTLIELMLAICIAIIILFVAVPSVTGLRAEKRLRETFEKFDDLARKAQLNAIQQQRSWIISWGEGVLVLRPSDMTAEERESGGAGLTEELPFGEETTYALSRPASLLPPAQTPAEWTFWRSGTCEPVSVAYSGPEGTWTADYNPLTGRGDITNQEIK